STSSDSCASAGCQSGFGGCPLWVANYGVTCPSMPTSFSEWKFWQYTDSGSVSGISGAVDLDQFNGTLGDLMAFANPTGPPPDASLPPDASPPGMDASVPPPDSGGGSGGSGGGGGGRGGRGRARRPGRRR